MRNEEKQAIAQELRLLAANLEARMHAQGWTEDALADASGVSKRTVGNFLRPSNRHSKRGTSKSFPSGTLANLVKIALALDVTPWELMWHDEDENVERVRLIAAIAATLDTYKLSDG